jgi:hypothetical protein
MKRVCLGASVVAILVASMARDAHALGPVDIELAAKGGYASDGLTADVGGRAGVSIFGIYAGFSGAYYFGKTGNPSEQSPPLPPAGPRIGYHQTAFGGELGYGFKISFVTLRPYLGFGQTTTYGDNVYLFAAGSYTQPYFQPGGLVQLTFGHFLVGVDGNAFIPTSELSQTGFVLNGEAGVTF